MKNCLLLVGFFIFSCDNSNDVEKYNITKYFKVDNGYQFSNDVIKYNSNTYRPIISLDYVKDTLSGAKIFKPDGSLVYTKNDLRQDPQLIELLAIEKVRKIKLENEKKVIYKKSYVDSELKNKKIYCVEGDSLFVYQIEK